MTANPSITVQDLGLLDYEQALTIQRERNQALIDGKADPIIFLVEHPPVITLTRRSRPNLLADEATLAKLGVATAETDRGGDITYHGPGQLVVYPILKLGDFGLNLSSYMRLLERTVIDTIANWEINGQTECGATGVWVKQDGQPESKICAMGVRIRKNTTMHGLALNVAPEMRHFDLIVPCGLEGRPVTSMQQLLGDECPSIAHVKKRLAKNFAQQLASSDSLTASDRCTRQA